MTLQAHVQVIRAGRTRVVCRCELYTIDGQGVQTLCAVAQGTVAVSVPEVSTPMAPSPAKTPR